VEIFFYKNEEKVAKSMDYQRDQS